MHERRSQAAARARGDDPGELLPAGHRVASLAKRWLLGTHQGSVDEAHLPAYLDEFAFRFNRRRSASRGMVFYRVLELAPGTTRSASRTCSPPRNRALPRSPGAGVIHRAWIARRRTGHGERVNSSCSSRFCSG